LRLVQLALDYPLSICVFVMCPVPPSSTLFPYTTLFRSSLEILVLFVTQAGHGKAPDVVQVIQVAGGRHGLAVGCLDGVAGSKARSEEHTSELQSRFDLVCRLLLEKKK